MIAPNVLSMVNRRHYPATGVYECKLDLSPTRTGVYKVYALKDNWDTIGAIRQAYKAYLTATESERAMLSKKQVARWEDFRISHGTGLAEMAPMVYNSGTGASSMSVGEFELSNAVDINNNVKIFTLEGASSATQYNIMTSWSASGNVDSEPRLTTSGAPYSDLEADHDSTQSDELQRDGNQPPYDQLGDDGIASPWTLVATLSNAPTGADGRISTGFFRAPLGMIIITAVDAAEALTLTVREGSHKGIKVQNILG